MIGLDGVVAQQDNYRKSGFALAYANIRYGGTVAAPAAPPAEIIALSDVPFAAVEADDATVFPGAAIFIPAGVDRRGRPCRLRGRAGWPACRLGCDPSVPEGV